MSRSQRLCMRIAIVAATILVGAGPVSAQQLVNDPIVQQNFIGITQIGGGVGNPTQMAFGPDGRLYVSTFTNGIKRFDVSPNGELVDGATVWSRPNDFANGQLNGSLGVAFHQDA